MAGTRLPLTMGPAAMDSDEPQEPRTTLTLSWSTRRWAALAASTLSGLLSATTSSILYSLSPTFTVGKSSLASFTPSTSIAPPAALAPVIGSNTPNLTVVGLEDDFWQAPCATSAAAPRTSRERCMWVLLPKLRTPRLGLGWVTAKKGRRRVSRGNFE